MLHHQTNHPIIILGALLSFLALASLFSITGCGDEPEPLKIGVIAPLTGPAGHLADLVDGMKLAVGEVNTWAGKEGRKIELVIEDSKSSADAGGKAFERIEKRHRPHFYISATSRVSMALAPRA
ncbi:MAG: ABC transporter substrate-binding protein, partial [Desulfobacterales bacterium]|nr:ABC transporter substrate-binding protein [Desulfobacterales bacterium]